MLVETDFPERRARAPRPTSLTPFSAYLQGRWEEGCRNATLLWGELRQRGYTGGPSAVVRYLRAWRTPQDGHRQPVRWPAAHPASVPVTFTPRQVCWLLLGEAEAGTEDERAYCRRLYAQCPQIALAQALVQEFRAVLRDHDVPGLYRWLQGIAQAGIKEFCSVAQGIWRDRAAVEAGVALPWSQGQTEGQVTRLKLTKRAGYGRAAFDLLRLRVLHAA